ncbi:uncharacterized protein MICPUCDRAFT_54852 [Micromonas pusilla CCMP1545]|uniref:Predicted protein n=1 Tax=Micromonas pusilla (strain CCMP1545) TaxID=564608 RepID=C1NAD2_MICPC|nr:uncharacterized protein MICPUCDRAFT_54852 [Micromonas pusilla CCMP1545]EEH50865.1 predicted protein [Micromonas pusilla CCMP1545]|eukprot:XP_003064885.1 predicted protein [Micromonas pusilla CCMP1545]
MNVGDLESGVTLVHQVTDGRANPSWVRYTAPAPSPALPIVRKSIRDYDLLCHIVDVSIRLVAEGADVNKVDHNGRTPLYTAAQNGHEAVAKALIEAGADASREGHEAVVKALIKALVEAGEDINKTDFDGETSLSWAADQGHEVMV